MEPYHTKHSFRKLWGACSQGDYPDYHPAVQFPVCRPQVRWFRWDKFVKPLFTARTGCKRSDEMLRCWNSLRIFTFRKATTESCCFVSPIDLLFSYSIHVLHVSRFIGGVIIRSPGEAVVAKAMPIWVCVCKWEFRRSFSTRTHVNAWVDDDDGDGDAMRICHCLCTRRRASLKSNFGAQFCGNAFHFWGIYLEKEATR